MPLTDNGGPLIPAVTRQIQIDELQRQLVNEHNKVAELQQDLQNVKSEHLLIKELEEQIRDVQNERTILKEHNEHLLALTSSKQNQNLEQEVALHSQIAQMENLLEKEQRERAQLVQQIEELKAVTHEQSHLQNSVSQEEALRAQLLKVNYVEKILATRGINIHLARSHDSMQESLNNINEDILYDPDQKNEDPVTSQINYSSNIEQINHLMGDTDNNESSIPNIIQHHMNMNDICSSSTTSTPCLVSTALCKACGKSFSQWGIDLHIARCHESLNHNPTVSSDISVNNSHVLIDSSPSNNIAEGFFSCPICPSTDSKIFKSARGLKIHCFRVHSQSFIPDSCTHKSIDDFFSKLSTPKKNVNVIPKGARSSAASRLSQQIDFCLSHNTTTSWHDLFLFAYLALRVPDRSGDSPSNQICRVEQKVSEGDIRGTVYFLSSDMGVADPTTATYDVLKSKHPSPSRPSSFPGLPDPSAPRLSVTNEDILKSLQSFPQGSTAGINGLRPQHLKDLVSVSADKLLFSFKSEQDIARLLALQESESGAWLHALPSPHIGTLIDSTSFKIAIALRLGCKLCQPHQCICGGIADIYGHHALSCARSKSRIPRHTSLNDIIKRSLTSCGIPSLLEPPGISNADGVPTSRLHILKFLQAFQMMMVMILVVDLQSKLAETLSEKTQILLNLEETKTQVNELKSAHDSLVIKLKDLQAQYTEAESQLLALQQSQQLMHLQVADLESIVFIELVEAPLHWSLQIRVSSNNKFSSRWIGHNESVVLIPYHSTGLIF
ncbi:hypothetical protein ANN_22470 [Periplaneta americana]|uniref:C2H2-type domain-containing protein n=1 Tax=Periplaneta americana TaxID=6978 RepID=A0ABQ8S882_PERAM|nr:hypothetical protein ANN_22470 [Periplaneta americana]